VLWAVAVGESGSLKTQGQKVALDPLHEAQGRLFDEHKAAGEDGGRPRRIICSDITIEKLAEVLEDNPRGVLVGRDELAGWLGSFTKYKGKQGGSALPNWLQLHGAGTLQHDRKTGDRKTVYVRHASACVTGGIQPGVLAQLLTRDFFEAGLVAR